ncbi:MAG TPA: flagellar assembly protein FliH [Accumulibacter sp.]|uniref:flagellar assembly protein FliH n=2 Tax=Accumulibacter sp. TaxID=2053492 RepID=UPI00261B3975|nr:flagellar assembly protein FliH [Accumulibacter sp.]MDS4053651.1 flagellar assembly protein FliH [Accumulibacter sp.]HMV05947.1 flagellar assembly protein FliH [Accumulibacter sp.]HMW63447.1 flagellar assembly protein FliH [Accumulibacter sp.]HMW79141.1 flagellar assembly protein FliH [Accumulibacter sp.]HMX69868.1 flagellar assembly protein FliH [Accumulibacter sp.]
MNPWIPKEKLTAYQRWEVAAFDEQADATPHEPPPSAPEAVAPSAEPVEIRPTEESPVEEHAIVLPTAEEIERMHREAHDAGYAAGYQAGLGAAQAIAGQLASVLDKLPEALAAIDQTVADELLALALEIANQVLRSSLRVRPELLLPVVREAVTTLHPHHGQPLLFAHPDDASLIRTHLGEQLAHSHWRILDDAALTPGGCRVELGASEVDATLETRWRRVIEAIGINPEWLAKGEPSARDRGQ